MSQKPFSCSQMSEGTRRAFFPRSHPACRPPFGRSATPLCYNGHDPTEPTSRLGAAAPGRLRSALSEEGFQPRPSLSIGTLEPTPSLHSLCSCAPSIR